LRNAKPRITKRPTQSPSASDVEEKKPKKEYMQYPSTQGKQIITYSLVYTLYRGVHREQVHPLSKNCTEISRYSNRAITLIKQSHGHEAEWVINILSIVIYLTAICDLSPLFGLQPRYTPFF